MSYHAFFGHRVETLVAVHGPFNLCSHLDEVNQCVVLYTDLVKSSISLQALFSGLISAQRSSNNDWAQSEKMMGDPSKTIGRIDHSNAILVRLAALLDCSPSDFLQPMTGDLCETSELLRLWQTIEDRQDRVKVLETVRAIASRS